VEAIFRNSKKYLKGNIGYGRSEEQRQLLRSSVDFWDKTFSIDFFTLRKKLRRVSYDILKSQKFIKKIHFYKKMEYGSNIYAPMDDDDIFMITETEYDTCVSNFNENCNLIVLGYYEGRFPPTQKYNYMKNPQRGFPIYTNNFLFKFKKSKIPCNKWVNRHNKVHELPYVKWKKMKHVETSLHLVHPCSITLLLPTWVSHVPNWDQKVKDHRDFMAKLINEYVNETNYKKQTPSKFWSHLETFKSLFSELKLK